MIDIMLKYFEPVCKTLGALFIGAQIVFLLVWGIPRLFHFEGTFWEGLLLFAGGSIFLLSPMLGVLYVMIVSTIEAWKEASPNKTMENDLE